MMPTIKRHTALLFLLSLPFAGVSVGQEPVTLSSPDGHAVITLALKKKLGQDSDQARLFYSAKWNGRSVPLGCGSYRAQIWADEYEVVDFPDRLMR